ncbi:hypothetical protein DW103_12830 [Parabacteroides sp. AM08-6]|nr:hypothetical protein DW103_12830 [Parabacteroides sp. AM08-6]
MNVIKANFLCKEVTEYPDSKTDIAQHLIFAAQLSKHVNSHECRVAILNSFPIFLYEYLKITI